MRTGSAFSSGHKAKQWARVPRWFKQCFSLALLSWLPIKQHSLESVTELSSLLILSMPKKCDLTQARSGSLGVEWSLIQVGAVAKHHGERRRPGRRGDGVETRRMPPARDD